VPAVALVPVADARNRVGATTRACCGSAMPGDADVTGGRWRWCSGRLARAVARPGWCGWVGMLRFWRRPGYQSRR